MCISADPLPLLSMSSRIERGQIMQALASCGLPLISLIALSVLSLSPADSLAGPDSIPNPTAELILKAERGKAEFRIHGLDGSSLTRLTEEIPSADRWSNLVSVSVGPERIRRPSAQPQPQPSILGSYRIDGKTLVFQPRFPLDRSIASYVIEVDPSLCNSAATRPGKNVRLIFESHAQVEPSPERQRTTIEAVYPSSGVLPENTLKFYIVFSSPMSRGEAYSHIRLLDGAGTEVADPFLELGEELWSVDGKRFTLLFDPGRIKRGLKPREEVGPVLEAGKRYSLVIASDWLDARGNPLQKEFRKTFRVGPPDETVPDPRNWTIRAAHAGSLDPLIVRIPEPLDRALADRLIAVQDRATKPIEGVVRIESEETVWSFTPKKPWREGKYQLVVGTDLEDLAGNSIGRRFEVDLVEPITSKINSSIVSIPFQVER